MGASSEIQLPWLDALPMAICEVLYMHPHSHTVSVHIFACIVSGHLPLPSLHPAESSDLGLGHVERLHAFTFPFKSDPGNIYIPGNQRAKFSLLNEIKVKHYKALGNYSSAFRLHSD